MKIEIGNGAIQISNSEEHTPRCFDVSLHATGRKVEVGASFWHARDESDEHGKRDAYVSLSIKADEREFEVPADERDSFRRKAVEQYIYLDVNDARELLDALQKAIDCADVR